MGPRSRDRGIAHVPVESCCTSKCFNGAAVT